MQYSVEILQLVDCSVMKEKYLYVSKILQKVRKHNVNSNIDLLWELISISLNPNIFLWGYVYFRNEIFWKISRRLTIFFHPQQFQKSLWQKIYLMLTAQRKGKRYKLQNNSFTNTEQTWKTQKWVRVQCRESK